MAFTLAYLLTVERVHHLVRPFQSRFFIHFLHRQIFDKLYLGHHACIFYQVSYDPRNVGQNIAATRCTLERVLAFGIRCLMYDGVIEELSSCCWK